MRGEKATLAGRGEKAPSPTHSPLFLAAMQFIIDVLLHVDTRTHKLRDIVTKPSEFQFILKPEPSCH